MTTQQYALISHQLDPYKDHYAVVNLTLKVYESSPSNIYSELAPVILAVFDDHQAALDFFHLARTANDATGLFEVIKVVKNEV